MLSGKWRRRLRLTLLLAWQVRINDEAEAVAVLAALLRSPESTGGLPRDLLVLNFGLHYGGKNVKGRLARDLQHLRAFLLERKVRVDV